MNLTALALHQVAALECRKEVPVRLYIAFGEAGSDFDFRGGRHGCETGQNTDCREFVQRHVCE